MPIRPVALYDLGEYYIFNMHAQRGSLAVDGVS